MQLELETLQNQLEQEDEPITNRNFEIPEYEPEDKTPKNDIISPQIQTNEHILQEENYQNYQNEQPDIPNNQENEDSIDHTRQLPRKKEELMGLEERLFSMIMQDNPKKLDEEEFAEMEDLLNQKETSHYQASSKTPKHRKRAKKPRKNLIKKVKAHNPSRNKGILERFEEPVSARRNPKKFLKAKSQRLKLKANKVSRVERVMKRNLWELGDTLKRKGFINYDTEYQQVEREDSQEPRAEAKWKPGKKDFVEGNKDIRLARKGYGGIRKRDKFIIGKQLKDFTKKKGEKEWRTQKGNRRERSAAKSKELGESQESEPAEEGVRQLDKKILEGLKRKRERKEKARLKKRAEQNKKTKMQRQLEKMYKSSYQVRQREEKVVDQEIEDEDSSDDRNDTHEEEIENEETQEVFNIIDHLY